MAFIAALGIARMIKEGISFEDTGIPMCMKTTQVRIDASKA